MNGKLSVHIEAPVEKVFDLFKDPRNWQEVAHGVVYKDVWLTGEGVGTTYSWAARMAGIPIEGFGVFTEFIPNQRITDKSSWSLEGTWTYLFESEGSGMKLTVEGHPRSFWRIPPLKQLVERAMVKGHEQSIAELKAKMEASMSEPAAERASS